VTSDRRALAGAERDAWDAIIRRHHHRVVISVLALGVRPSRAHEIANDAWARLLEKRLAGELETMAFPGLAITQARFLAFDDLRATARERRRRQGLEAIRDLALPAVGQAFSEAELQTIAAALADCSQRQQMVFRMIYANPGVPHDKLAAKLGLSVQRVRQILCEVRRAIRDRLAERGDR